MQTSTVPDDLYVVERIIGKRVVDSKIYYKVKWEGYDECDSTWEKLSHLKYVTDLVKEFEKSNSAETNKPSLNISDDSSLSQIASSCEATVADKEPTRESIKQVLIEEDDDEVYQVPLIEEVVSYTPQKSEKQEKQTEENKGSEKGARLRILTESAEKLQKNRKKMKEERMKCLTKEREQRRLQKKEGKRKKQLRKEESKKNTELKSFNQRIQKENVQDTTEKHERSININQSLNQSSALKGEEDEGRFELTDVKIRLIVAEDDSDIRDYVVVYPNGTSKVFNTCQMFYTHPVEFVTYLEKRTSKPKK